MSNINFNQKTILLSARDFLLNSLSRDERSKTYKFVEENKERFFEKAKEKNVTFRATPKKDGVARSIFFTALGHVFLVFNRKKTKGDLSLSETPHKTVELSVDLETGQSYSSSSMDMEELLREKTGALRAAGIPGCEGYAYSVDYVSKGKRKARAFRLLAERGDLEKAIPTLSLKEKKIICHKLLFTICAMHKKGLIHRDIKTKNILIYGRDERIRPVVIDLS